MSHHTRAILAQLSVSEREFFSREPGFSWLAGMSKRLLTMTVPDGAKFVRANMTSLAARAKSAAAAAKGAPASKSPPAGSAPARSSAPAPADAPASSPAKPNDDAR